MNIAEKPAMNPGNLSATIAAPRTPMSATAFGPHSSPAKLQEENTSQAREEQHQDHRRIQGVGLFAADRGRKHERPEERAKPQQVRRHQGNRLQPGFPACRGEGFAARVTRTPQDVSAHDVTAAATCSGVSQPGPKTRAICGANTGESPRTSPGLPSAITSPVAIITTRVATCAASSTSCVASITVRPLLAQERRNRTSLVFDSWSRPRVGSSSSNTGASVATTDAIATSNR